MRVLKITPVDGYEVTDIPDRLETLQEAVGGLIKVVWLTPRMVMIINEEGKLKNLPDNDAATVIYQYYYQYYNHNSCDVIVGNALIVGVAGDEFADLSDKQVNILSELLNYTGF